MQSNAQLACQACFQLFKQDRNLEVAQKPNMVSNRPHLVQATVGAGTVLIWDFSLYKGGGGVDSLVVAAFAA